MSFQLPDYRDRNKSHKLSKSKMTREDEERYDMFLKQMVSNEGSSHFTVGTYIVRENRKALIIGKAVNIIWVEWEDGSTEMITPLGLVWEKRYPRGNN